MYGLLLITKQKRIKHLKQEEQHVQWPWGELDAPKEMKVLQSDKYRGEKGDRAG